MSKSYDKWAIKSVGVNENAKKAQEALRTPKRFAKRYWIFAKRFGVRKASCALLDWDEDTKCKRARVV